MDGLFGRKAKRDRTGVWCLMDKNAFDSFELRKLMFVRALLYSILLPGSL